jgi:uncharacterized protein YhaN
MEDQGSADNQQASGDVENQSKDKVAYETYRRAVAEAKTAKERLKVLESEREQQNNAKLKEQNEWKTYAEQQEKKALEESARREQLESTILESVKLNAFQRHLGGRIKDDAYYQFVDTDKMVYNPETKRVDEESVKSVVADFVKRHSSLIEFKQGKMPNEAGGNVTMSSKAPEEMTREELDQYIKSLHASGKL